MIRKAIKISCCLFSNFNASKDYYKILSVNATASPEEIKKSFRALAKKHHPDANKGNQEKFKQINQAYQVLSSQITKKDYDDARRSQSQQSTNNSNYNQYSYEGSSSRSSYRQEYPRQQTYRGYQRDQGWSNRNFREQTINEIFRQQQQRFYKTHKSSPGSNQHDENLWQRSKRDQFRPGSVEDQLNQSIRRQAQRIKITRESVRKAYEEQQKRREKQFKQFQQKQNEKIAQELKKKAWSMVEGAKLNVEGLIKVGKYVKQNMETAVKVGKVAKNLWDEFKNSKKK